MPGGEPVQLADQAWLAPAPSQVIISFRRSAGGSARDRVVQETQAVGCAVRQACDSHGVPLAAAALQFSLREARIAATIVGISAPERLDQTLRLAQWPIPAELWDELEPLISVGRDGIG